MRKNSQISQRKQSN